MMRSVLVTSSTMLASESYRKSGWFQEWLASSWPAA
jgi:hypothetical protein